MRFRSILFLLFVLLSSSALGQIDSLLRASHGHPVRNIVFPNLSELTPTNSDTIFVSLTVSPPFVYKDSHEKLTGLSVWLWEEVATELKLNYAYLELPFEEMLSSVSSGSSDVSINPLSISANRLDSLHFGLPFYASNSAVLIHEKSFAARSWNTIQAVFSADFLRVVGLLFLLLFVFGFLVWFFERKSNPTEFEQSWRGILSGIWWSAVTMTTVGYGDKSPRSLGGRIVALIWMFTAVVTISGFTASIASSLTVSSIAENIESMEELRHINMATMASSATYNYLESRNFSEISEYNQLDSALSDLDDRQIDALAYDEPILRYKLETNRHRHLKMLPFRFNQQFYSFAFSEMLDEEMRTKITRQTQKVLESDTWEHELDKFGLKPF